MGQITENLIFEIKEFVLYLDSMEKHYRTLSKKVSRLNVLLGSIILATIKKEVL